jgi:hypothetical protein
MNMVVNIFSGNGLCQFTRLDFSHQAAQAVQPDISIIVI